MVIKLGEIGSLDLGYLEMLNCIENGVEAKDIPDGCELKVIENQLSRLGIETLSNGTRLILRDGREILVPKEERARMLEILHYDHTSGETMLRQMKGRIFWPNMRQEVRRKYEGCQACTVNRMSLPQKRNEISLRNVFENFYPGEFIEKDY